MLWMNRVGAEDEGEREERGELGGKDHEFIVGESLQRIELDGGCLASLAGLASAKSSRCDESSTSFSLARPSKCSRHDESPDPLFSFIGQEVEIPPALQTEILWLWGSYSLISYRSYFKGRFDQEISRYGMYRQ
jgi:hypothetical protein